MDCSRWLALRPPPDHPLPRCAIKSATHSQPCACHFVEAPLGTARFCACEFVFVSSCRFLCRRPCLVPGQKPAKVARNAIINHHIYSYIISPSCFFDSNIFKYLFLIFFDPGPLGNNGHRNGSHCSSKLLAGSRSCSHDHMSVGLCTNCLHSQNLPTAYQHFGNPRL